MTWVSWRDDGGVGGAGTLRMEMTHFGKVHIYFDEVPMETESTLNWLHIRIHQNLREGLFSQ